MICLCGGSEMCGGAAFVSFFERNVSQQPPQESQRFSVLRWCFFPRRANKKGALLVPILALPACLASRRFPPYLFELIAVSAQTRTKKKCVVCKWCALFVFWRRTRTRCPTGRICTKELPGWQSTSGDRKKPRTARRDAFYVRWNVSRLNLVFSVSQSSTFSEMFAKLQTWWAECLFKKKIDRYHVSAADRSSWYWIALCVLNEAGQILWILRTLFCAISWYSRDVRSCCR